MFHRSVQKKSVLNLFQTARTVSVASVTLLANRVTARNLCLSSSSRACECICFYFIYSVFNVNFECSVWISKLKEYALNKGLKLFEKIILCNRNFLME